MNQNDLSDIASRAASLWERLQTPDDDSTEPYDEARAQGVLELWRKSIGGASEDLLGKRIEWAGCTVERVRRVLGSTQRLSNKTPAWLHTLQQISDAARAGYGAEDNLPSDSDKPLPFEELLFPAVLCARRKQPGAPRELERSLLQTLAELSTRALEAEYSKGTPVGRLFLAFIIGNAESGKKRYDRFVKSHLDDGLRTVFREYPVLGRLMSNCVDLWVEASSEFLSRVQSDLELLGESGVAQVRTDLSDPHNGHRGVLAVTFNSGRKLVYKPKNLGLEEAFYGILRWCNDRGIELALRAPVVWNRGAYGWVEYIEHLPCSNETEARRYFERAGMLLCLLYMLQATDCHLENIIASGEQPVLVDAETLLQPEIAPLDGSIPPVDWSPGDHDFANSVIRSGLLPRWEVDSTGVSAIDLSALGGVGPQDSIERWPRLKCVNTDNMHFVNERTRLPESGNAVRFNEKLLNSSDFVDSIISGFKRMYLLVLKHRDEFLSENGPLETLRAQPTRFLFRATRIYGSVLIRSATPEFLRDGAVHSVALDAVSRAFLTSQERPRMWPILEAEIKSMEQRDIPYFATASDSAALVDGLDQPIEGFFDAGLDRAVARIRKLSPADMDLQLALIRGAFAARNIGSDSRKTAKAAAPVPDLSGLEPLTRDELVTEADCIAEEIRRRAFWTDSGLYWLGLSPLGDSNRFHFRPLGQTLYEGACGVALFLAALDDVTGQDDHFAIIDQAVKYVRKECKVREKRMSAALVKAVGIGGITGISSVIYALVRIGDHLKREDLCEDAVRASRLLTTEVIDEDRQFDVMSGSAGAILGLLALHRAAPCTGGIIETAIHAGKHLLKNRTAGDGELRAWKNSAPRPLTGFSHGAAGIAYALARLYEATHDSSFLDAACEGIAYERSLFVPEASNWPDLRAQEGQDFACSWCHGAAGIGLARLGVSATVYREDIRSDIAAAVRCTSEATLDDIDHLCCGNFGRVELMLQAGHRAHALRTARWIYQRAKANHGYRLVNSPGQSVYSPALFRGTAGIGYQLLRLAESDRVPSVLLMQ